MPGKPRAPSTPKKSPRPPTALSQPNKDPDIQTPDGDAVSLLTTDHRRVEELFGEFEKASTAAEKRTLANAICLALKVHARVEEDLFYPAVFSEKSSALLAEARVEHASAKDLIAQIEAGAPGEPLFEARVKVLGEYVRHHVTEEEDELFPLARKSRVDLAALGREIALLKQELERGATVSNPILAIPA